jgi:hypothetical protein
MEHTTHFKASSRLDSQEIPRLFLTPKGHYCVNKIPGMDRIPSQMNPVHILTPCLYRIHSNVTYIFEVLSSLHDFRP